MGFFSRLFGGGNDDAKRNDSHNGSVSSGVTAPILRTTRHGGYDKNESLTMFDRLTTEIFLLEEAVAARDSGRQYQVPPEGSVSMPNIVNMGGFNEEDVNEYVENLKARISDLRAKLGQ